MQRAPSNTLGLFLPFSRASICPAPALPLQGGAGAGRWGSQLRVLLLGLLLPAVGNELGSLKAKAISQLLPTVLPIVLLPFFPAANNCNKCSQNNRGRKEKKKKKKDTNIKNNMTSISTVMKQLLTNKNQTSQAGHKCKETFSNKALCSLSWQRDTGLFPFGRARGRCGSLYRLAASSASALSQAMAGVHSDPQKQAKSSLPSPSAQTQQI